MNSRPVRPHENWFGKSFAYAPSQLPRTTALDCPFRRQTRDHRAATADDLVDLLWAVAPLAVSQQAVGMRSPPPCSFVFALLMVAQAACPAPEGVYFSRDIAPLVERECIQCHQPGAVAPFPLTTFAEVKAQSALIATSVQARRMPPFNIDNSGDCQTFQDAKWLSDEEIEKFVAWDKAGAPDLEGADQQPLTITPPDALVDADVSLGMTEPYTPSGNSDHPNDDYRCFLFDADVDADAYLTGFEVVPGQPAEVHHMLLFALLTEEADNEAAALDEAEAGPGWTCFGDAGVDDFYMVAAWAPGTNVKRMPEGTGLFVPGGRKLVMQIHYNLLAGVLPDQTSVKLRFADEPVVDALMLPVTEDDFVLAPNDPAATTTANIPLFAVLQGPLKVHGVFPHMHTAGRSLTLTKRPFGDDALREETCMVDVPHWDFNWQETAFYDTPLVIDGSEKLRLTCNWDTTGRTGETRWGEGTQEEMCLAFVYVTRDDGGSVLEWLDEF
jgi:hypothetical protein